MATSEARLEAFVRLAKLITDDDALLGEIAVAWNEPERHYAAREERYQDIGIDAQHCALPLFALLDGLRALKQCEMLDWRENPSEMVKAVRGLLRRAKRTGWKAPKLDEGEENDALMRVLGDSLESTGLSLCGFDTQSDSLHLVLVPTEHAELATELARLSDITRLQVHRNEPSDRKPPPPIRPRTVIAFDVARATPPLQFVALPRRRFATFEEGVLTLVGPEGEARTPLDREVLPDFDPDGPSVEHVLVRSGQRIGVLSRRFVRLWSPAGDSVLYSVNPPLEPNTEGRYVGAVRGGISDDPNVVVAVFHRAAAASDDVHPVVLALSTDRTNTASLQALDQKGKLGRANRDRLPMSSTLRLSAHLHRTPRLGAIAWLDDNLYVVARGNEEPPGYAVYCRYYPPFGHVEQLIDLGEDCIARVSSSGAHLLVTHRGADGVRHRTFSLAHLSRPGQGLELPAEATLLDHEDDAFWYFEPRGSGGRYVLADGGP